MGVYTATKVMADLKSIAKLWDRNIVPQGFLEAKALDPHDAIEEPLFLDLEDCA